MGDRDLRAERDRYIRAFNRLDAAVSHHKRDMDHPWPCDTALYHARDKILADLSGAP